MRKWIVGVATGFVLMVSAAVVIPLNASNAIYGVLFPSSITIHNGSETKTIEGTGDNGILNYNNKAYIPLRAFSEAMGATVRYEPASEQTGGLHKLDIYQGIAPIAWTLERTEDVLSKDVAYCSAYQLPFFMIPTSFPSSADHKADTYNFNLKVHNLMPDDISVKPIELIFEVKDEAFKVIYSRPLPPVSGVIPSNFGYNAVISWDHTGLDGKEVPSGNYFITLKRPAEVSYNVLGSDEEKSVTISYARGCNLGIIPISIQ